MNVDDLITRINDLEQRLELAENAMSQAVQKRNIAEAIRDNYKAAYEAAQESNCDLTIANKELFAERIAAETRIAELEQLLSGK